MYIFIRDVLIYHGVLICCGYNYLLRMCLFIRDVLIYRGWVFICCGYVYLLRMCLFIKNILIYTIYKDIRMTRYLNFTEVSWCQLR